MAFSYDIDHEAGVVTVRYESPLTFQAWRETMDRILADPEYQAGYDFIGDRRGVPDVPTTEYAQLVVDYFDMHRQQFAGAAWAHVVDARRDAVYGMARMVEILVNMKHVLDAQVFEDEQEAWAWLATRQQT